MPSENDLVASVAELRRELAAARRDSEQIRAALYDLQLDPPEPASGKDASYRRLVRRIRELVRITLPPESRVVVVSKGDDGLLDLYGRHASHFPQAADGRYSGYYPKSSLSVIAHLEAVRACGAEYLLLPTTALWWLDHYPGFFEHLQRRYPRTVDDPDACVLYSLREKPSPAERPFLELEELVDELVGIRGEELTVLEWGFPLSLPAALLDQNVFAASPDDGELPYLDSSIDVVLTDGGRERAAEARRVASVAVVTSPGTRSGNGRAGAPAVSVKRRPGARLRLPSVSIVVPCHNEAELTRACLGSLCETLPQRFEGEILVVDDASSDDTAKLIKATRRRDDRVRGLRNRTNLGFVETCNRGAQEAQGEYLLFLNNDTILLPGWLPPLLRTFNDFSDAGVVGGRLLYTDGRLQEAGGLVFSDGSAAKFGYGDPDADAALYSYVREVDYVSGALLLTPRSLFSELGGFDRRYGFGFYDDDDYCFAVRAAGRRVYYQPECVVVHVEGGSTGTDLRVGAKQFQLANQSIFQAKWSDELAGQPRRPDPLDASAQRLLAARGCWNERGRS